MTPGVAVVQDIKDDADGVEESARQQPPESAGGECGDQRIQGEEHQPAHADIDENRKDPRTLAGQRIQDDADQRQAPDGAEHPPARGALQGQQGEGGIGAGDQQIDGMVIERAEDPFRAPAQAVVEGRKEIEQEQRDPIDAEADDPRRAPFRAREGHQDGRADQR